MARSWCGRWVEVSAGTFQPFAAGSLFIMSAGIFPLLVPVGGNSPWFSQTSHEILNILVV